MADIKLSTVKPDYDQVLDQITSYLRSNNSWKDLIEAATGQILAKFISGGVAYNQYSIERAVQENYIETARNLATVLQGVRDHGVRIQRKSPGSVPVTFTRESSSGLYAIPAYSKFKVGDDYYFNRLPIVFVNGSLTATGTLEEGELVVHSYTSTGEAFQRFWVGSNYTSSDSLVRAFVDGTEWNRITSGIWAAGFGEQSFSDQTSILGELEVTFGNGVNGVAPTPGSSIEIHEYIIKGAASNNAISGIKVLYDADSKVTGLTSSVISGADDERTMEYYKEVGARLGRSLKRAVTRSDYNAICRSYPGVLAADCRGEYDIQPGNQSWQSTVGIYLVTQSAWTNPQKSAFLTWLQQYAMLGVKHQLEPVTSVVTNITAQLLVDTSLYPYDLDEVISAANTALQLVFKPKSDSLGKEVYKSEIYDCLKNVAGVKYVNLSLPSGDVITVNADQYFLLGTITLTAAYV